MKAPWIVDRFNVKVLDCTIRDGGLVNNHCFTDEFVEALYKANIAAGIDYMEIGYKNSEKFFPGPGIGPWKFCKEDDLRRIVGENPSSLKLACMIDAGKSDWKNDVLPFEKSPLDMIRVAFYAHQLDEALEMIEDAYQKGYEVSANMMAVAAVDLQETCKCIEKISKSNAAVIVVVDSFGSITTEHAEFLTNLYTEISQGTGKEIGMHAHNNQQLGFASTIESIRHGATRVDASYSGLGRGAGNCPMELLLGYLKGGKYDLRVIYECIEKYLVPLRKEIEWGPYPEYMITGQFNLHPRTAIAAREGEKRDHLTAFYDEMKALAEK